MKLFVLFLFIASAIIGQTQPEAEAKLEAGYLNETESCYTLELRQSNPEPLLLSGQNYRLFYGSAAMEFDESSLSLELDEDLYTMKLVQHQNHVDGSHVGVLPFDKDLGFINLSIMLNGTNTRGDFIPANNEWKAVSSFCFTITDNQLDKDIVLARSGLTTEYGRAYVELSFIDENGVIQNLPVLADNDIHISGK